jgi:hypothetical protein
MTKYKIKNYENGEILTLSMEELLFEINRDRSNEWIDYTEEELEDPKMIEEALSLTDYSLMDVI